ncbi:IS3 family transposase, partial [Akkermansiaceae bacterium]|nr:IS3 family transposase [Akkermansiaceae bacterium]
LAVSNRQCSQRKASSYFRLHRSTLRYRPKFPSPMKEEADEAIVELSLEHPELGSDKVGRLVRNRGLRVSSERVREVRREECLQVPPPKKKQSRRGVSTGRHPTKAQYRGHVWTWDFIHDSTVKGGSLRILSVVDEYTRETHALYPARNIGSGKVLKVMSELIARHGAPDHIRSDNGPEFVAKSLQQWLAEEMIRTLYIEPDCPWQNGFVESFQNKFRRECLARELFYTLSEARVVIAEWRKKYNELRPHRSLGMKTPEEFALGWEPGERWRAQHAPCVTASGLHSGSMLTSGLKRLSRDINPLTLSGP